MSTQLNRPTHRQVTIEFRNKSGDTLSNPCTYVVSGYCDRPLPPTLSPGEEGTALFVKTPDTACGSVGVVTYDLQKATKGQAEGKMALMFSNPYDFNLYSNWFAIGIFDMTVRCDYNLYEIMYYEAEQNFVRGKAGQQSLIYKDETITIRASMSDSYTPDIQLQVISN